MAGPVTPVAWSAAALAQVEGQTPKLLWGYTLRETAGAVATVRLRDKDVNGVILAAIALAANASVDVMYATSKATAGGVFMQLVAGTVEGSVSVS